MCRAAEASVQRASRASVKRASRASVQRAAKASVRRASKGLVITLLAVAVSGPVAEDPKIHTGRADRECTRR